MWSRPIQLDWRWVAAITTGLLLNLAQSVTPWWPAMWVALIPLLSALLFTTSLRETVKLATLSSLLGRITTLVPILRGATMDQSAEIVVVALLIVIPFSVPVVVIAALWRFVVREGR